MKMVELKRVESTGEATIGVLSVDGRVVCWSLEEPWKDNMNDISCIPEGRYPLRLEYSPLAKRRLWTVSDVPGRSYVRVHTGNTVDDTEGCLLTGSTPGELNGKRAVLGSRDAFAHFMMSMSGCDEAEIRITSV